MFRGGCPLKLPRVAALRVLRPLAALAASVGETALRTCARIDFVDYILAPPLGQPGRFAPAGCAAIARIVAEPFPEENQNYLTPASLKGAKNAKEESELELGGTGVRIYHLCDDGVISTRQLVEVLAAGMGRPARLLSLPRMLALTAGSLLGKGAQVRRLYGNLEVDGSDFCRDYNWQPPVSLEDGLREMARSFMDGEKE